MARCLRKFRSTIQILQSLCLRIEVPKASCAGILGARATCLKVPSSLATALDEQEVVYVSNGTCPLKDATGIALPSGPFHVRKVSSHALELYDSADHAQRAGGLLRRHVGRQKFTPIESGRERLGSLSLHSQIPQMLGMSALAEAVEALPNVSVVLRGSGFQRPFLQELQNVEVRHLCIPAAEETDSAGSSGEDSASDGGSSD